MHIVGGEQLIERRPMLGILLGATAFALAVFFAYELTAEYRGFAKEPESVDLKTVVPPPESRGRWVRIEQPLRIDCAGVREERQFPESLLFGKVEATFFLAEVEDSDRTLLLQHDGETTCEQVAALPMVGVLEEMNSRRRSFLLGGGFTFPYKRTVLQFCVTCGPKQTLKMLWFPPVLALMGLYLIYISYQKYQARKRELELTRATTREYPSDS